MKRPNDLLVLAYVAGTLGLILELGGGTWDVATHILRGGLGTENFWTVPHSILYSGVALVGVASLLALLLRRLPRPLELPSYLTSGLFITAGGTLLQLFAGGFDQWWHATFGLDVVLFSPPHALLIIGMAINALGMVLGTIRLRETGLLVARYPRILQILCVLALVGLWSALDGLVYLFTNLSGYEYTFHLPQGSLVRNGTLVEGVELLGMLVLALIGTLVLLTTRRTFGRPGYATVAALGLVTLVTLGAIIPLANAPPTLNERREWWTIPAYLAMVLPVALLDFRSPEPIRGPKGWATAAAIAPVAFALDGWYSTALFPYFVAHPLGLFTLALLALTPMGPLALLLSSRFTRMIRRAGPSGVQLPTAR